MVKDLVGQRFGRLVVIEKLPSQKWTGWWRCKCDCGNIKDVPTGNLTSGNTQSCGCLAKEIHRKHADEIREKARIAIIKHGLSSHRICSIWEKMIYRCENSKSSNFKHYGGKGIKVCEEWHDLRKFYEWAINNGYKDNLEIDRIDNSKDYCPENCRWASSIIQANNKDSIPKYTYQGETHGISEWARILNISRGLLKDRITKLHWDIERAFTTPPRKCQPIEYNGEVHTWQEWSDITGISKDTLQGRYYTLRWSIEETLTTPVEATEQND